MELTPESLEKLLRVAKELGVVSFKLDTCEVHFVVSEKDAVSHHEKQNVSRNSEAAARDELKRESEKYERFQRKLREGYKSPEELFNAIEIEEDDNDNGEET